MPKRTPSKQPDLLLPEGQPTLLGFPKQDRPEGQQRLVGLDQITAKLRDYMGEDSTPALSAWVSTGKDDEYAALHGDRIPELTERLLNDKHFGCFEHNVASFHIAAPVFIARQFMRHRTFSYNEVSGRYKDLRDQPVYLHKSLADNGEVVGIFHRSFQVYRQLREVGFEREVARQVLSGFAMMTTFIVTGNLRSWAHFVQLRADSHAQEEIQHLAKQIRSTLTDLWPMSSKIFSTPVFL
jgi:thymidylate synthase (FAD)